MPQGSGLDLPLLLDLQGPLCCEGGAYTGAHGSSLAGSLLPQSPCTAVPSARTAVPSQAQGSLPPLLQVFTHMSLIDYSASSQISCVEAPNPNVIAQQVGPGDMIKVG